MLCKLPVLIIVLLFIVGCSDAPLYSALKEPQANEVSAALMALGIDAKKQRSDDGDLWMVSVPNKDFPRAMAILTELGLPKQHNISMGEIFKKEGFVSSPIEEKARYLYALSQELSQTLCEIDGVVSAGVHVALPDKNLLDKNIKSASVSVSIIQEPNIDLSSYETDIKAIITDGIEGLHDVNQVTVKFFSRRKSQFSFSDQAIQATNSSSYMFLGALIMLVLGAAGGAGMMHIFEPKKVNK